MLLELVVRDLGVIEELSLVLGAGMTAITGETGAGKTLVVDAVELLVGGRADPGVVRHGADEAVVEGRFAVGPPGGAGEELVVRRVVPRQGRSRAYVDGRLATVAELAELGRQLVDLHGQHAHQSLLATSAQRSALDRFGQVQLAPLARARAELAAIEARLAELGGDERARARQLDLARYQLAEITAAAIDGPDEDERLDAEEDLLGDALAHQEAGVVAADALVSERGALDGVAAALGALGDRSPYAPVVARLRGVEAELADLATEVRGVHEGIDDDPEALTRVRLRRAALADLRRKYGDTLAEVLAQRDALAAEVAELEAHDVTAARLDQERAAAAADLAEAARVVGAARRAAAPELAAAVQGGLRGLAMERARLAIEVGEHDPGDDVTFLLAANPGAPPLPLAKVASGGELARAMLALRLVLTEAPGTLVFDEVDAGIGGSAALAVGRALGELGRHHQVLVVTHLPQVAAAADHQVVVAKAVGRARTSTSVAPVEGGARVAELARMLSGTPGSEAARTHAVELLGEQAVRAGVPRPR